jgi:hypothetical protein
MVRQSWARILCVGALVGLAIGATHFYHVSPSYHVSPKPAESPRLDAFLRTREAVYQSFRDRYASLPQGVKSGPDLWKVGFLDDSLILDDSQIRGAVLRRTWNDGTRFLFYLTLDENALVIEKEGDSDITAKALFDHYFGGLTDLGFRVKDLHVGGDRFAQNVTCSWEFDKQQSLQNQAEVVVDLESKRAMVEGRIQERFEE